MIDVVGRVIIGGHHKEFTPAAVIDLNTHCQSPPSTADEAKPGSRRGEARSGAILHSQTGAIQGAVSFSHFLNFHLFLEEKE